MYLNNTLQDWLISGGIIAFALLLNWIISILNKRYLRALAKRTKNQVDNIIVNSLETPLKVGIVLIAIWTAISRLQTSEAFDLRLYKIYEILTVLNVTWFFAHLVKGLLSEYFTSKNQKLSAKKQRFHHDTHFISLITKISSFIIWTIGLVTALNNVGLDLKAILGTLGIGGVAVALAAQDTVKNVFGGFTILTDGTFRIGDAVKIGEFEGRVEDIGVRSTKIRTYDKRLVTMPNYKIMDIGVTNITAAPQYRIVCLLDLLYDTSPKKMQEALDILRTIAKEHTGVSDEGIVTAFDEFGDFALKVRFVYFIEDPSIRFDVASQMNLEILKRFHEAGIEFAYPTQTLMFENAAPISPKGE